MDIENRFYFLISRLVPTQSGNRYKLEGRDFHGGLSAHSTRLLDQELWLASKSGVCLAGGKIDPIHRQGHGYHLEWQDQMTQSLPLPSLLTTDREMKWAYSGPVDVRVNDPSLDICEEADFGLTMCGGTWLGVIRRKDGALHLDAFSIRGKALGESEEAFCPEWSESLDDLIFTIVP